MRRVVLAEGTSLAGRYTLRARVGAGGMSTVWRARDEVLERDVAVKVLKGVFLADPVMRARLFHEARAIASIDSPHVVRVHDYGVHPGPDDSRGREGGRTDGGRGPGIPFVVMEFAPGPTLRDRLSGGRGVPASDAVRMLAEIATGLAAVHAVGVVHRDVKPSNVIFDGHGVAKVADFGIARNHASADLTDTGTLVGTAKYLAPEQVEGKAASFASDVYALGLVTHECLTGVAPFVGESDAATALARLSSDPAPLPVSLPAELRTLVEEMTARDPVARPTVETVAGIAAALFSTVVAETALMSAAPTAGAAVERAQTGQRTRSFAPGATRLLAHSGRLRRRLVAALSLALVATAVGAGVAASDGSGQPSVDPPSSTGPIPVAQVEPSAPPSPAVSIAESPAAATGVAAATGLTPPPVTSDTPASVTATHPGKAKGHDKKDQNQPG